MVDNIEHKQGGRDRIEATDALRRRLLKASAAAVPAIVSLQSGTAWALSSCADNITGAGASTIRTDLGDNRDLIASVTGIDTSGGGDDTDCDDASDSELDTIICNCDGDNAGGPYPAGPADTVEDCEVLHLLVTNGSCWSSYCNGPIGVGDVTIDGNQDVCNGAA